MAAIPVIVAVGVLAFAFWPRLKEWRDGKKQEASSTGTGVVDFSDLLPLLDDLDRMNAEPNLYEGVYKIAEARMSAALQRLKDSDSKKGEDDE